jgi:ribonucleoside-diphosphate reductase alpha subunit
MVLQVVQKRVQNLLSKNQGKNDNLAEIIMTKGVNGLPNTLNGYRHAVIDMIKTELTEIINYLCRDLSIDVDKVVSGILKRGWYEEMIWHGYNIKSYDSTILAGRMLIYSYKQEDSTAKSMHDVAEKLQERLTGNVYRFMMEHAEVLDKVIEEEEDNDLNHDWFSANTIMVYLAYPNPSSPRIETPQQFFMRVAVALHYSSGVEKVCQVFRTLSRQFYTHATPTNLNAGMERGQLASCFLMQVQDDLHHIVGVTGGNIAQISKFNGGIGMDISLLRHSEIGKVGMSQGIVPAVQVYDKIVRYANQTGNRKGAAVLYLRTHHIDLLDFIQLTNPIGDHNNRTLNLKNALWTSLLFWARVIRNEDWSLFCPNKTKKLNHCYGNEFIQHYLEYEQDESVPRKTMPAREILHAIIENQRRAGQPYILHEDACNFKSNQKNLGYIRCSNLCVEIVEYTAPDEIAVCNLASVNLKRYLTHRGDYSKVNYDYNLLGQVVRDIVINLNQAIEENYYPVPETKNSNMRHRPIGIGVSGLADVVYSLDYLPESEETRELNRTIFACIYFNAVASSINEAIKHGCYDTFPGSPASQGDFQFDLWRKEYEMIQASPVLPTPGNSIRAAEDDIPVDPSAWGQENIELSNGYIIEPTWESLRKAMITYGLRNSLLLTAMPTATTSQLMRNNECFEFPQSNIYTRDVLKGSYTVLNHYLERDLKELGLWNQQTMDLMLVSAGSVKHLPEYLKSYPEQFPEFTGDLERLEYVKQKYKTMWELDPRVMMKYSADRGRYICQSQSLNLYLSDPTIEQMTALHIYGAQLGLKTGMYYLRQNTSAQALKIVDPVIKQFVKQREQVSIPASSPEVIPKKRKRANIVCTDEVCTMCQS